MQSSLLAAQIISRSHFNARSCCLAACAQLTLLKMDAEQQQSVDFKSCLVYFTSRLCDCAVQTSAVNLELAACHLCSFIQSDSFPRFAKYLSSNASPASCPGQPPKSHQIVDRSGMMFAMPYTGAFPSLTQLGSSFKARTESLRSCTRRPQVINATAAREDKA